MSNWSARRLTMRLARTALAAPGVQPAALQLLRRFARPVVTVFMLHRFSDPELGSDGASPEALRAILSMLRRQGVEFLELSELIRRIEEGERQERPGVVFTIDDGFIDFARVVAPVFSEFDCPSTVFLVSEIVSKRAWFWWSRLEYAFNSSSKPVIDIEVGGQSLRYRVSDAASRSAAADSLSTQLKVLPEAERRGICDRIGSATEVDIPATPPLLYQTLTWDDARRLEASGVRFGPHTRTHPILSTIDDESARSEIEGSWSDLREQCANAMPVFCYPNGSADSFGERDVRLVKAAGMRGAVMFRRQRIAPERTSTDDLFRLPRTEAFGHPFSVAANVSGLTPDG